MKGLKELNALREAHGFGPIYKPDVTLFHPASGIRCFASSGGKPIEWFASRGQLSDEAREERRPPSPAEQLEMNDEVPREAMTGRGAKTLHSQADRLAALYVINQLRRGRHSPLSYLDTSSTYCNVCGFDLGGEGIYCDNPGGCTGAARPWYKFLSLNNPSEDRKSERLRADLLKILDGTVLTPERFEALVGYVEGVAR